MAPMLCYTLQGFAIFFFIFWCSMWILHLVALCHGRWRLHRKPTPPSPETPLPGVSIIKPLIGVDPNLFSNLETFFTMDYPQYEILFCIQDSSDPVIMLVNSLKDKYPKVDTHVFIGGEKCGVNPKINNMLPGYNAAKYDLVLISDSGLRMKPDTLLDMVSSMTENVGLVHQMPFAMDRDGFAATVEKIYFGTTHARIYLSADLVRINCPTGMSELIRKPLLDEVGGIKAFSQYLAEDFFFAKSVTDRGWSIRISSQPAWQNSGAYAISIFQDRIARWTKMRIAMVPLTILFEPLSECMLLGVCTSWATYYLFHWDPLALLLVHILVWFLLDWILLSVVQNGPVPFSKFEFVIGWLFRECSHFWLFLHAMRNPNIRWRTGLFRLRWGGVVDEIKPKLS